MPKPRPQRLVSIVSVIVLLVGMPAGAQTGRFVFQNNFWVNLHHLLRGDARRQQANIPLVLPLETLDDAERAVWQGALDVYRPLAARNLIFDDGLIAINGALARAGEADRPRGVPDEIASALINAASIARKHFWPEQRRRNDAWIAAVRPAVTRHGQAVTRAIAKAFRTEWPRQPILVDVAGEAGAVGAYTTPGPPNTGAHSTIASTEAQITGDAAVEIVFHEATHAIDSVITKLVEDEATRQGVAPPEDLWHALLFYTVGDIFHRELARTGKPGYVPYADRFGVYRRWSAYRRALEAEWRPYLRGQRAMEEALRALVRAARS